MTPLELLARLAALVPPPRYPLVRYHGVLAPHATWLVRLDMISHVPSSRFSNLRVSFPERVLETVAATWTSQSGLGLASGSS
jgi:hypothetical protein